MNDTSCKHVFLRRVSRLNKLALSRYTVVLYFLIFGCFFIIVRRTVREPFYQLGYKGCFLISNFVDLKDFYTHVVYYLPVTITIKTIKGMLGLKRFLCTE